MGYSKETPWHYTPSMKMLRSYANSVPGTLTWLPPKHDVDSESIILLQETKPDSFSNPALITQFRLVDWNRNRLSRVDYEQ
jgi:hypothetical protein